MDGEQIQQLESQFQFSKNSKLSNKHQTKSCLNFYFPAHKNQTRIRAQSPEEAMNEKHRLQKNLQMSRSCAGFIKNEGKPVNIIIENGKDKV